MRPCRVKLRAWAGIAAAALCLFASTGVAVAQEGSNQAEQIRYHFGDDPDGKLGWADPNFDDSAWTVANDGRWSPTPILSNGFEWVRLRVPVRSDAAGPLAIRVSRDYTGFLTYRAEQSFEVFVNGRAVARRGSFPPGANLVFSPEGAVFPLPPGVATPGKSAVVCYRLWLSPLQRFGTPRMRAGFAINESSNLLLANHADKLTALLGIGPELGMDAIIAILGISLFIFWRRAGGRELLWCSALLLLNAIPPIVQQAFRFGVLVLPWPTESIVIFFMQAAGMAVTVEFMWAIFDLRGKAIKRFTQIALVIFNVSLIYIGCTTTSGNSLPWLFGAAIVAVNAFDLTTVGVDVWALISSRGNRLVAAALIVVPVASILTSVNVDRDWKIGIFYIDLFGLGRTITALALFVMLGQRAWAGWRARDELRVEFEAAREMQEQLVAPAVDLPGFKIDSVYAPARQVGGDFFRILPWDDGSVLVIAGDVSGKGLKAAMTVSAIMGALPGCRSRRPSEVLAHLNEAVYGRIAGFVTCSVALIESDGALTIANAGNPAPYCNGEEMALEAGLPLGMIAEANYAETSYRLAPGDQLTFVSDGVIEATNAKGELFGFDRTQATSTKSAAQIAKAAQDFGQEDDITVLTLERA